MVIISKFCILRTSSLNLCRRAYIKPALLSQLAIGEAEVLIRNSCTILLCIAVTKAKEYAVLFSALLGNDIYNKKYQTYSGLYAGMFAVLGNTAQVYNNQQRFLLYRLHIPDPIHFETGFRMTLDNLGWTGPRYDDYTSVAYWYQTLPSTPLKPLPTDAEMILR